MDIKSTPEFQKLLLEIQDLKEKNNLLIDELNNYKNKIDLKKNEIIDVAAYNSTKIILKSIIFTNEIMLGIEEFLGLVRKDSKNYEKHIDEFLKKYNYLEVDNKEEAELLSSKLFEKIINNK